MAEPKYPTGEGLWSRGTRPEPSYRRVRFGLPYRRAVENFRRATEGRGDFDPATLLVWGTMQATGVLNVLKEAERTFGEQGQAMVRRAINAAGREAMAELLDNSEIPEELEEIEKLSFLVTAINTILYASLERPRIDSPDRCEFDILWCPHQDRYTAFDCRVQRYFVEGMFEALEERGYRGFTAWVEQLIPRGADCCHFVVERLKEPRGPNPWRQYSDQLGKRALQRG